MTEQQINNDMKRRLAVFLRDLGLFAGRADLIRRRVNKDKSGLRELSLDEGEILLRLLGEVKKNQEESRKKMGSKVIALLAGSMEWTTESGSPDYDRINKYVKEIGSANPYRRKLWELKHKNMIKVLNQVEAMVKTENSKLGKNEKSKK